MIEFLLGLIIGLNFRERREVRETPIGLKSGPPPELPPRAPILPKEKPQGSTGATRKKISRISRREA